MTFSNIRTKIQRLDFFCRFSTLKSTKGKKNEISIYISNYNRNNIINMTNNMTRHLKYELTIPNYEIKSNEQRKNEVRGRVDQKFFAVK